jgi:hypothetical protein
MRPLPIAVAPVALLTLFAACAGSPPEAFTPFGDKDAGRASSIDLGDASGERAQDASAGDDSDVNQDGASPLPNDGDANADGGASDGNATDGESAGKDGGAADGPSAFDAGQVDADAGGPTFTPPDPFTIDTSRPPISFAGLAAYIPAGGSDVKTGWFTVVSRSRHCTDGTGCSAWSSTPAEVEPDRTMDCAHALITSGTPEIELSFGPILELTLSAPSPAISTNVGSCVETFQLGSVNEAPDSGAGSLVSGANVLSPEGILGNLEFPTATLGPADVDGIIQLNGRINDDGTFQAVSQLGQPTTAVPTPANMQFQIAIYGHL